MTVLHLAHESHGGGATVSIALLARAQAAMGKVLIGCTPGSALEAMAGAAAIPVEHFDFSDLALTARRIGELARQGGIEIVNAHSSRARAACRRLGLAGAAPALVITRRAMPRSLPFSVIAESLLAQAVIAVSRGVGAALLRRGQRRAVLHIVPNAVDEIRLAGRPGAEACRAAREAMGWSAARPTIGVFARRKDQDTLLDALRYLEQPVTVACIGTGPDAGLAAQAARAERHHVALVPFQADVRPFYESVDVSVLPTRDEGCSQALLEAMWLGKPVVTTSVPSNMEVIRDGVDGLLVPPRDPVALAAALARLLADPALARRLGGAARERARSEFTIERTARATHAVYRAALTRRRARRGAAG